MRRALGRQLAAMRNRAGLSQWDLAPLTGYSRSTLSDAELGRHRLRREFWLRCDGLLKADGRLVAAYDRIETAAAVISQRARSTAQLARDQHASARLQAVTRRPAGPGAGRGQPAGPARRAGAASRPASRAVRCWPWKPARTAAGRSLSWWCPVGRSTPGPRAGPGALPSCRSVPGLMPPCNYTEDTCVRTSAGRYWEASALPDAPNLEVIQGSRAVLDISHMPDKSSAQVQILRKCVGSTCSISYTNPYWGHINEHEMPEGTVSSASGQRGFLP